MITIRIHIRALVFFLLLSMFFGAAVKAQNEQWAIPDPYPIPSDLLSDLFLSENRILSPDALRYAQYTDYSIGCYAQFYEKVQKFHQLIIVSEAMIDNWDQMERLGGTYDKALYAESEQGLVEFRASLEFNEEILRSFVPHINFGLKNLAERHTGTLISSATEQDYTALRNLISADPRRSGFPLCPDSLQHAAPTQDAMVRRSQIPSPGLEQDYESCTSYREIENKRSYCSMVVASAAASSSQKARALKELADISVDAGDIENAIVQITQAIELKPDEPRYTETRAFYYFRLDEFELAVADFSTAIPNLRRPHFAYQLRGTSYEELGEISAAISDFQKCFQLPNGRKYILGDCGVNAGELLLGAGRYEEAITAISVAIDFWPEHDSKKRLRGHAYRQAGLFEEAISDFKLVEDHLGLAWVYLTTGDQNNYENEMVFLRETTPNNPDILLMQADVAYKNGDMLLSQEYLEEYKSALNANTSPAMSERVTLSVLAPTF